MEIKWIFMAILIIGLSCKEPPTSISKPNETQINISECIGNWISGITTIRSIDCSSGINDTISSRIDSFSMNSIVLLISNDSTQNYSHLSQDSCYSLTGKNKTADYFTKISHQTVSSLDTTFSWEEYSYLLNDTLHGIVNSYKKLNGISFYFDQMDEIMVRNNGSFPPSIWPKIECK